MCGIAGIVSLDGASYRGALERMADALSHRGPDDWGQHVSEGIGLIHTRLSIVDLDGGHQPMASVDGRYIITFNGEIYGYKDIRRTLNYDFKTNSDTEVILALYMEFGADMMSYINGMFAFAIWDSVEKRLFCARDRFGEKPFYYSLVNGRTFVFASEIKSLLESRMIRPTIDERSLAHYLRTLYVHPFHSIYKEITTLKPGHYLEYKMGQIRETRYWEPPGTMPAITMTQAVEEIRERLVRAVERQLVADVPVGAFLSGGLDSSTVVAAAAKLKPDLMTLSYRFKSGLDEGVYAKAVADVYRTQHIELVEQDYDLLDIMKKLSEIYDEPFADSSSIPTYLICQEARKHCKVVLTGDGADELFGGYVWKYRPLFYQHAHGNKNIITQVALLILFKTLHRVTKRAAFAYISTGYQNNLKGRSLGEGMDDLYWFFSREEIHAMGISSPTYSEEGAPLQDLNDVFKSDLGNYMPGDILVKTDRASMASGLELRAPFLDKDLAEYVIGLPAALKFDSKRDKIALRETFADAWPALVRNRGKQGFGSPIGSWLSRPEMREAKAYYLSKERRIARLLDSKELERYRESNSSRAWALLTLSIWCETWKV